MGFWVAIPWEREFKLPWREAGPPLHYVSKTLNPRHETRSSKHEAGAWGLLVTYIMCGVCSNLASVFLLPSNTLSLGASGAVFGLFTVAVATRVQPSAPNARVLEGRWKTDATTNQPLRVFFLSGRDIHQPLQSCFPPGHDSGHRVQPRVRVPPPLQHALAGSVRRGVRTIHRRRRHTGTTLRLFFFCITLEPTFE